MSENTRRIKLTVEYDGSQFHGWQRQHGLTTVQGCIEDAIFKITGQRVNSVTAGRTDAGVHGKNQVCHFDLVESKHKLIAFKDGINRFTPESITILKAEDVCEKFHARFSAKFRRYEFKIINRREPLAIMRSHAVHVPYPLDLSIIEKALPTLLGEQNFNAFRTSECMSSTPMCNMRELSVKKEGDTITFTIEANHFLHNMIRILVGTAVDMARGNLPENTFETMLKTGERSSGGTTLAPNGLYFESVSYDENSYTVFESC